MVQDKTHTSVTPTKLLFMWVYDTWLKIVQDVYYLSIYKIKKNQNFTISIKKINIIEKRHLILNLLR